MTLNICIAGYGKMGKEIEKVVTERKHNLVKIIDQNNSAEIHDLKGIDVVIDFTNAEVCKDIFLACFKQSVPVISGTTGNEEMLNEIYEECKNQNSAFLRASNFSIGVNLLFELNQKLAKIISPFTDYKCNLKEIHHIHKKDAPSGTAITLLNDIIKIHPKYNNWSLIDKNSQTIKVDAVREGEVKGFHTIKYENEIDEISISHNAKSRKGFALGAVLAAEFIHHKKGVFSFKDVLNSL